jgi:hypothetical protein
LIVDQKRAKEKSEIFILKHLKGYISKITSQIALKSVRIGLFMKFI